MSESRPETRTCAETGKRLVRSVRPMTFGYKGHEITLDQPGWYAEDGGPESLHDAEDIAATDAAYMDFKATVDNVLTADEVRHIRRRLGLSQRAAGELLGGGARAFQKYESGQVRLSVPMSNLLRLLANDPHRLAELHDDNRSGEHEKARD